MVRTFLFRFTSPVEILTAAFRSFRQDLITRPLKHAQKKEATAAELALGRSRASALVGILLPHFWLRR